MKQRLDQLLVKRQLVPSRHQAQALIELGKVKLNGRVVIKPSTQVGSDDHVELLKSDRWVSRGGHKLTSVIEQLGITFDHKIVLDVGASTGGFTQVALARGASKIYAVDVGTDQLDPSLRADPRVVSMEKTDIRSVDSFPDMVDVVVIDVSFISLRLVLAHLATLIPPQTDVLALVKPQFETGGNKTLLHKGVVKNDTMRREILKEFEIWAKTQGWQVKGKADSELAGAKGNRERFYLLRSIQRKPR
ncbi:TlyA family RNA methyltransferase [Candidatus Microgenomates bacterium]|nr:TlyA family RNA methyltransferase [Candidatus Microgenomates bacterium]